MAYTYNMQTGDNIITILDKIQDAVNQGHCLGYLSMGGFRSNTPSTWFLSFGSNLGDVKINFPTGDFTFANISKITYADFISQVPEYNFLSSVAPFSITWVSYYYGYVPIQYLLSMIIGNYDIVSDASGNLNTFRDIFFVPSNPPETFLRPIAFSYCRGEIGDTNSHIVPIFVVTPDGVLHRLLIYAHYNQAGVYSVEFIKGDTAVSINFIKGDKGDPGPAGGTGSIDLSPLTQVLGEISTKITTMNNNLNTIAGIAVPSVPTEY